MQISQRACFFQVKNFSVAVEAQYTEQVLRLDYYTKLPRTRADFLGLIYVQGRILPLLDLYTMFQFNASDERINLNDTAPNTINKSTSYTRAVIVKTTEHEFALASTHVLGFFSLPKDILPSGISPALRRYVIGDVLHENNLHISVINIPTLVNAISQRLEVI